MDNAPSKVIDFTLVHPGYWAELQEVVIAGEIEKHTRAWCKVYHILRNDGYDEELAVIYANRTNPESKPPVNLLVELHRLQDQVKSLMQDLGQVEYEHAQLVEENKRLREEAGGYLSELLRPGARTQGQPALRLVKRHRHAPRPYGGAA